GIKWGSNGGGGFSGGEIRSNTIEDNDGGGISMSDDQDGCDVNGNTINSNTDFGIRIISDHHRIHGNSITGTKNGGNGGHGIVIESSAEDNCLDANAFKSNFGQAIQVAGDRNYLVKNTAKGNDGFVKVSGADDNDGRNNATETGTNDFP
ncbi:MAG TPA: right-handed parallel beta-helix repeat-containing protein, partial [Pirellulaceae bacterium]|nr:right-handed parallel beta-helix repeat-containing protein [Pirellulaceae bacterium]